MEKHANNIVSINSKRLTADTTKCQHVVKQFNHRETAVSTVFINYRTVCMHSIDVHIIVTYMIRLKQLMEANSFQFLVIFLFLHTTHEGHLSLS